MQPPAINDYTLAGPLQCLHASWTPSVAGNIECLRCTSGKLVRTSMPRYLPRYPCVFSKAGSLETPKKVDLGLGPQCFPRIINNNKQCLWCRIHVLRHSSIYNSQLCPYHLKRQQWHLGMDRAGFRLSAAASLCAHFAITLEVYDERLLHVLHYPNLSIVFPHYSHYSLFKSPKA